jgi:hypothetical protein
LEINVSLIWQSILFLLRRPEMLLHSKAKSIGGGENCILVYTDFVIIMLYEMHLVWYNEGRWIETNNNMPWWDQKLMQSFSRKIILPCRTPCHNTATINELQPTTVINRIVLYTLLSIFPSSLLSIMLCMQQICVSNTKY